MHKWTNNNFHEKLMVCSKCGVIRIEAMFAYNSTIERPLGLKYPHIGYVFEPLSLFKYSDTPRYLELHKDGVLNTIGWYTSHIGCDDA